MIHQHERPDSHERYEELCALVTSGMLTDAEGAELKDHLRICEECREAHNQYLAVTQDGMPMLALHYGDQRERNGWDGSAARQKLFDRIQAAERHRIHFGSGIAKSATVRIAVAASLMGAVGIAAYTLGRRAETTPRPTQTKVVVKLQEAPVESKARDALLSAQAGELARLRAENLTEQQRIESLQAELHAVEDHSNELASAKKSSDEQLRATAQQRDLLAVQLKDAVQSYEGVQAELSSARTERDNSKARLTSLEDQVAELSVTNRDQEQKLRDQQQYLASDRDIRELMGARQLYIADVFDVSSDSRTRKPYGRVFYTKGKSLIFYAYDLDRQPGIKNAHTFQAWGQKEAESRRPLNLGILYMDSEANRRWVLRVDEPKQLAEIDSIFVTVEPQGGSYEPTGKRFLYASLRKEVNHP